MKPERIQKLHAVAPGWHVDGDAHTLSRRYAFPTAAVAQSFARFVLGLAEVRRTYPRVSVEKGAVEIVFPLGSESDLDDLPFAMAEAVEDASLGHGAARPPIHPD